MTTYQKFISLYFSPWRWPPYAETCRRNYYNLL